jgi:hypothetical protein
LLKASSYKSASSVDAKCFVVQTFEEMLTEIYSDFFKIALKGGDLEEVQSKLSRAMTSQGLSIVEDRSWNGAFKTLIDALKSCSGSSESDKAELKEVADSFVYLSEKWVRSQPGLGDFPASPKLRADPRNAAFFAMNDQFKLMSKNMVENPAWAISFFNDETAAAYANFIITVIEVSRRAVEMENCK